MVALPGGGTLRLVWNSQGVMRVVLPPVASSRFSGEDTLREEGAPGVEWSPRGEASAVPEGWRTVFRAYFAGEPVEPAALPLGAGGTPFQRRVWRLLRCIPRGRVRTYGEIARRLGMPGAARAVGRAAGANPVPLVVPCHRLVARGGCLGGFSSGLGWKRRLLELEGFRMDRRGRLRRGQLGLPLEEVVHSEGGEPPPPMPPPPVGSSRSQ